MPGMACRVISAGYTLAGYPEELRDTLFPAPRGIPGPWPTPSGGCTTTPPPPEPPLSLPPRVCPAATHLDAVAQKILASWPAHESCSIPHRPQHPAPHPHRIYFPGHEPGPHHFGGQAPGPVLMGIYAFGLSFVRLLEILRTSACTAISSGKSAAARSLKRGALVQPGLPSSWPSILST